jgi:hypothetical protein
VGGVIDFLKGLFSGAPAAPADAGLYVSVKCDACGEIIQARISPSAELSLDDDGTYFVRKVVVGRQCFRSIEILLRYASVRGKELSREVQGGTSVD